MIYLGINIAETITRPSNTEATAADMLSFNVACNPLIVETRTRPANTEVRAAEMLSFKVACNTPGKMVEAISGSGGPWG